ncbi:CoA transferase, partial [Mycobacterium intracellulare]
PTGPSESPAPVSPPPTPPAAPPASGLGADNAAVCHLVGQRRCPSC